MSGNVDNDRSQQAAGKLYPMDLAPKITIVKSGVGNDGPKVITQTKGLGGGQITTHAVPLSLMRPTSQMVSQGVTSQMIVSREHVGPLLQGAHIISQGTQLQLSAQGTQIINQATTLMASQGSQGVSVGGSLNSGGSTGTSLISSSGGLRTVATGVRVLAPLSHSSGGGGTPRPTLGVTVTSVSQLSGGGAVARGGSAPGAAAALPPVSHVPRGAAAVASLAAPRPAPPQGWGQALAFAPRPRALRPPPSHYRPSKILGVRTAILGNPPSIPISAPSTIISVANPPSIPPSASLPVSQPSPVPLSLSTHPAVAALECTDSSGQPQTIQIQVVSSGIAGPGLSGLEMIRSSSSSALAPTSTMPSQLPQVPPLPGHYTPTSPARPSILRKRDIEGSPLKNHTPNAITALATAINTLTAAPSLGQSLHHTVHPTNLSAAANLSNVFNSNLRNLANIANSTDHRNPANVLANNTTLSSARCAAAQQQCSGPMGGGGLSLSAHRPPARPPSPPARPSSPPACPPSPAGSLGSGSTTVSADSSPAPSPPPRPPRAAPPPQALSIGSSHRPFDASAANQPVSPRKKPRKQMLSSVDVRQCDRVSSPTAPIIMSSSHTLPPVPSHPAQVTQRMPAPHRRAMLANWRRGGAAGGGAWRATARHFWRPGDVRAAPAPRPALPDPPARRRAARRADGWKLHHIAATFRDLMDLESSAARRLERAAASLERLARRLPPASPPRVPPRPAPCDARRLLELARGALQRGRAARDGLADAERDALAVFRHRALVQDILTRQADKRCFKKHRN